MKHMLSKIEKKFNYPKFSTKNSATARIFWVKQLLQGYSGVFKVPCYTIFLSYLAEKRQKKMEKQQTNRFYRTVSHKNREECTTIRKVNLLRMRSERSHSVIPTRRSAVYKSCHQGEKISWPVFSNLTVFLAVCVQRAISRPGLAETRRNLYI